MTSLLDAYKNGKLKADDVQEKLMGMLYDEGEEFLLDLHRRQRLGFPEIVFCEGKTINQVLAISKTLYDKNGYVFLSVIDEKKERFLKRHLTGAEVKKAGKIMFVKRVGLSVQKLTGCIGIITAGTADIPFAKECALILGELGYEIVPAYDIGASGMHRPLLGRKKSKSANLLIVFAGMDGVLPTLIASLTDLPVIAVPTPIGYGHGGQGEAALSTMLQCCVPGVLVVNIGNSVGAAAAAVRILNTFQKVIDRETR